MALIMVVLLLFAVATPPAHGHPLNTITVGGRVCCTPSGNCLPGATGIPGVPVVLNCSASIGGGTITVGRGVTGVNGVLNITVPNLINDTLFTIPAILGGTLPCSLIITLPLNQTICPVLNTATGVLTAIPVIVGSVLSPVLGFILNTAVTLFIRINI